MLLWHEPGEPELPERRIDHRVPSLSETPAPDSSQARTIARTSTATASLSKPSRRPRLCGGQNHSTATQVAAAYGTPQRASRRLRQYPSPPGLAARRRALRGRRRHREPDPQLALREPDAALQVRRRRHHQRDRRQAGGPAATSSRSPRPKQGGEQLTFDTEWTADRLEENDDVNRIRSRVALWRRRRLAGHHARDPRLLEHWTRPDRERSCSSARSRRSKRSSTSPRSAKQVRHQTTGSRTTCARRRTTRTRPVPRRLQDGDRQRQDGRHVHAHRLAGAQQAPLTRSDNRFTDAFLVVAPGITIRDRLRVLLPSDPNNYYRELDIVPAEYRGDLGTAQDRHHQLPRLQAPREGRRGRPDQAHPRPPTRPARSPRSPDEMVQPRLPRPGQAPRDHGHQRRGAPLLPRQAGRGEGEADRRGGKRGRRTARRRPGCGSPGWRRSTRKIGVKAVYDLSATPFYLKGSGYPEGTLFPWVVSDFSLMDAIESRHRQDPARARRRQRDDRRLPEVPRPVGSHPRRAEGRAPRAGGRSHGRRCCPACSKAALQSLYGHYARRSSREWEADEESRANGSTPPVFIVVCNNTNVSKAVFDYIAGYETDTRTPTASRSSPRAMPAAVQQREGRPLAAPAEHDPRGQPAARIRRGHVRRLQEAGRSTRSRTSRPSTAGGSPAATPRA